VLSQWWVQLHEGIGETLPVRHFQKSNRQSQNDFHPKRILADTSWNWSLLHSFFLASNGNAKLAFVLEANLSGSACIGSSMRLR
jgi:hypothetical protein